MSMFAVIRDDTSQPGVRFELSTDSENAIDETVDIMMSRFRVRVPHVRYATRSDQECDPGLVAYVNASRWYAIIRER